MNIFEILFFILLVLYILWVISFLFLEKRKPDSMVSWLLIFIIFPFIGFLIYLIFGRDFSKKKIFRLYSNEEKIMIELKKKNLDLYKEKKLNFKKILDDDIDIMELTSIMSATGIYFNNKVKIFKFQCDHTPFLVVLLDSKSVAYADWFLLGKYCCPRITFFLRIIPVLMISRCVQFKLSFLHLRLLNAENVCVRLLKKIHKSFSGTCTDTIYIP